MNNTENTQDKCAHFTWVECPADCVTKDYHTHHCQDCGKHEYFGDTANGVCTSCEA